MAVVTDGRRAVTGYRVRERFAGWTLLELDLVTGRTHQIRVHLAALGHPVAGDPVYGTGTSRRGPDGLERLFLHAWRLELVSPSIGQARPRRGADPRRARDRARGPSRRRDVGRPPAAGRSRVSEPETLDGAAGALLVIISGPSGVGKDTIIDALRARDPKEGGDYHYVVTCTTRVAASRRDPRRVVPLPDPRRVPRPARRGRAARGERGPRQLVRDAAARGGPGPGRGPRRDPQDRRPGGAGRQGTRPRRAAGVHRPAVARGPVPAAALAGDRDGRTSSSSGSGTRRSSSPGRATTTRS